MSLSRLIYISENQIDPAQGSVLSQLNSILSASNRNNQRSAITGALVFDDMWFVQVLEGPRKAIWSKFEHIKDDDRHASVVLVEMLEVEERVFGNWWMGLAKRSGDTEPLFAPFVRNGRFRPDEMSAGQILALARDLAAFGLSRELAAKAA